MYMYVQLYQLYSCNPFFLQLYGVPCVSGAQRVLEDFRDCRDTLATCAYLASDRGIRKSTLVRLKA